MDSENFGFVVERYDAQVHSNLSVGVLRRGCRVSGISVLVAS